MSRLEEIKQHLGSTMLFLGRTSGKNQLMMDLNWLIEQAERFERLSEIHYQTLIKNRRYKEALELIEENIYDVHGITEILERTLEKDNKEE